MNRLKALLKDKEGATAIEYGLIAALISVAILTVLSQVGDELLGTFEDVRDELQNRGAGGGGGGGGGGG